MCARIQDLRDLHVVSDGGAVDNHGSYGWVIGLSNETHLAQGHRVVYMDMAHCCIVLRDMAPKPVRFSSGICSSTANELYQMPPRTVVLTFIVTSDNKGLLKKLALFQQYENVHQAPCLHSEWDIASSVFWLPKLIHVKGHQDNNYAKEDLNLPTKMNIKADALATTALKGGKS
jgi:hypothetical protein